MGGNKISEIWPICKGSDESQALRIHLLWDRRAIEQFKFSRLERISATFENKI